MMTAAELVAGGATITITSTGLTAPKVTVACPKPIASELRAALDWRVAAMRAQTKALGGARGTLVARGGLTFPLWPPCTARVAKETREGRVYYVEFRTQRPATGRCLSCGDDHAESGNGGDCILCCAARIAALRAEGMIAAPELRPVETFQTAEAWRQELYASVSRSDAAPAPMQREAWTCKCGNVTTEQRDPSWEFNECGKCELKRISVCDTRWLGGKPAEKKVPT